MVGPTEVAVWDALTMTQQAETSAFSNPRHLLFRDQDTLIVSSTGASSEQLISIWNWRTNRVLKTVEPGPRVAPRAMISAMALSPDRRRIALILHDLGGTSAVSIWDEKLRDEIGRLPPGDYSALAFSPDGRRIVSVGAEENVVRIWDAEQLRPLLNLDDIDSHLGGVAFTATGQIVAGRTKGGLTIWDTQIRQR
jgi:WD40 repeat protein